MTIDADAPHAIRVVANIHDRAVPFTDPAAHWQDVDGSDALGSYLVVPLFAQGPFAIVDQGARRGFVVYHVPADGSPAQAVITRFRGRQVPGAVSPSGVRSWGDALAWHAAVRDAGILPADRRPSREEVRAVADLIVRIGERR